eukprot:TRINITY_DN2487_c0_g1_i1.p1 TRINITY_DN2487_c0_g1~~TRINITY_DN2487_c0_g1_i1.p1  ORF type:complete len:301 (-),score=91.75 TRINITY_DN2487_c0_g1_i1:133-1011(-)
MTTEQNQKVVLITGCSSGIGRALVHEFRGQGCRVFASARDLSKITDLGDDVVRLDMLDSSSFQKAVDEVVARAGRIDMLVNNAGVSSYAPAVEATPSEVRRIMDTNFFSVVELTQYVCTKYMIPARSGTVVMISSMAGEFCTPFNSTYSASKAALTKFSDGLRMEVAPFGIKIITVKPGGVKSEIANNASVYISEYLKNSLYNPIESNLKSRAGESQHNPMPSDAFAKKVVTDILRSSPTCIITGTKSTLMWTMSLFVPYWLTDYILSKRYGLTKLAAYLKGSSSSDSKKDN